MNTEVLDNFTAISFLANGNGFYSKPVLLLDISWEEYESYLKEFEERAGWKLTYDEGKLEFMPPLAEHEFPSKAAHNFALAYCEHFDLTMESGGSTTFRRKAKTKGVEPDECFYVASAEKIIGEIEKLKPETYPVPDVAVEMDVTHGSLDKFKIYAALGVPELWIYDGKTLRFYQLTGAEYNQSEMSSAFPLLSADVLTGFLADSKTIGQLAALKKFRQWLAELES